MRTTHFLLTILFIFGVFTIGTSAASVPDQIDVRSMHITYSANASDAWVNLTAHRTNGLQVVYGGLGSVGLSHLNACYPCQIPSTFSSNGFQAGLQFNWGMDKTAYFFIDSATSDPIVVSPRYTWKRRNIAIGGRTLLHGRIEIRDQNTIIAIDPDVTLNGNFSAQFFQTDLSTMRRAIQFTQIDYELDQPAD